MEVYEDVPRHNKTSMEAHFCHEKGVFVTFSSHNIYFSQFRVFTSQLGYKLTSHSVMFFFSELWVYR